MPRARRSALDRYREPLTGERKIDVLNRLKSARGHLDGIVGMVDDDAFVIDVMRQIAAVRGALDAATRVLTRQYLERFLVNAAREGASASALDEVMDALAFAREPQK